MTETKISCPKCGADLPLTEAVSHRLRENIAAEFEQQRTDLNAALAAREQKLAADRAAVEQQARAVEATIARRISSERQELLARAAREAEDKLGMELKDLRSQLEDRQSRLKTAQEAELELRRKTRELEEAKALFELDVTRRLDAERQKIAESARQHATATERFKLLEKEKIISDLQREIQNLKQKAEQGSMQLQGEALELDLEQQLHAAFPADEILEVKKGQRGADVTQRVRTGNGLECGTILWEAKHARNWSGDWPEKLKADQREAKAELAVIVTTGLPDGVRSLAPLDGVWVCEPALAVALASALRQGLISVAVQRVQQGNRADKMTTLYNHLCSVEFRQQFEAIVEAFLALQEQLAAEQRAFARQWREREQQLQKALAHTAMVYGGIQGIAGREALPELKTLALPGAT